MQAPQTHTTFTHAGKYLCTHACTHTTHVSFTQTRMHSRHTDTRRSPVFGFCVTVCEALWCIHIYVYAYTLVHTYTTYCSLLRSSSMHKPRDPLSEVVNFFLPKQKSIHTNTCTAHTRAHSLRKRLAT